MKFSDRQALRLLKTVVSPAIKQQMLDGAKVGMKKEFDELKKKGQCPTVENLMGYINPELYKISLKAGITIEDYRNIAAEIVGG